MYKNALFFPYIATASFLQPLINVIHLLTFCVHVYL